MPQPTDSRDERKLVTVFFADVSGFTALAETLDPELLRDLLNGLFDRLVPSVEAYGGTVDKFIGDCLMALFGAPVTHDDDAARAVRAALEMRETVESFNREKGIALAVHFGVNTGLVVAGSVGGGGRRHYSVVGDAVNVAKRLEEASEPGEILIGTDTRRRTMDLFEVAEAGSVAVRGRTEAVAAYRVLGERIAAAGTGLASRSMHRLIGREEELNVLAAALDRLRRGLGGVAFVVGEAGLGKSRLLAELKRRDAGSVRWLEGRTASFGRSLSYLPFKEILCADSGFGPHEGMSIRSSRIRSRLDEVLGGEWAGSAPALANLLGLPVSEDYARRLTTMDERGLRAELFDSYRRYLARVAARRPVVVVLEDLHWLDASSCALLGHLLPLTEDAPVLFILSSRPGPAEHTSDLLERLRSGPDGRHVEVLLQPLSVRETGELVACLLESGAPPAGLERTIEQRSGGNPLFAGEIVRHLVESGRLDQGDDGQWRVTRHVSRSEIPDTLQGVIAARVDALPGVAKRHLGLASVIGRAFSFRLLHALAGGDMSALRASLDRLERVELISRRVEEPELVFAFKHALIQEATYQSMLLKDRRGLHMRVAALIERSAAGMDAELSPGDPWGLLAYHCTRAEDWERAQNYLVKAGDRAAATAGDAEARWHYQQAIDALLRAFDAEWQVPGRLDPIEWFVRRLEPFSQTRQLGSLVESFGVFREKVLGMCGPTDPRTIEATCMLALSHMHNGSMSEAESLLEAVVGGGRRDAHPGFESPSRAYLLLGMVRQNQDRFPEAERLLAEAVSIELSRPAPDWGILHDAYSCLSSAYYFMGRIDLARGLLEEAIARHGSAGDWPDWGILLNLSSFHLIAGDVAEAAVLARRCLAEAANPFIRAYAARHLAAVLHAQGAYAEAESYLLGAVGELDELGREYDGAIALADLAETRLQKGDVDAAQESAESALRTFDAAGYDGLVLAPAYWTLGGVALVRGRLEEAERLLLKGREICEAKSSLQDPLWAELTFRLARVLGAQHRDAEADDLRLRAATAIRALGGDRHPRLSSMLVEWEE